MKKNRNGRRMWKKFLMAVAVAAMVCVGASCAKSPDDSPGPKGKSGDDSKVETTTEILTDETVGESAILENGVTLPENFDNMPYVMEALMVQEYAKNMPYYTPDTPEKYADSFYYSMAVLASLIEQKTAFGDGVVSGKYYYLSEETVDKYAAALYDSCGQGNMEFPPLSENDIYAMYDEDIDSYAFIVGDVGDMMVHITECTEKEDKITLKAALYNGEKLLREYRFHLVPTSFIATENEFAYSVTDMKVIGDDTYDSSPDETGTDESSEDVEESAMDYDSSGELVPIADARKEAAEYAEEEVEYDRTEEIEGREYYFFITSSDKMILVDSHDIQNVFGAKENGDGSWTFDQ